MPTRRLFVLAFASEALDHLNEFDMKAVNLTEAKASLHTLIDQLEKDGPIIITRNGKDVAVLRTPADDEEGYRIRLAHSPEFRAMIEKSERDTREGRVMSSEQFWKAAEERAIKREQARKRKPRKQPA